MDKTKSELAVPIMDGKGQVIGVINLEHQEPNAFTLIDQENVVLFADQAGIVLRQKELSQTYKRLTRFSEALRNITQIQDAEVVLQRLVYLTKTATDAHWVTIILFKETSDKKLKPFKSIVSDPYPSGKLNEIVRPNGISYKVLRKEVPDPEWFEFIEEDNDVVNPNMIKRGIKAAICLPLVLAEKPIGVMWIHYDQYHSFPEEEREEFQLYADQAAAIYNFVARSFGDVNESLAVNLQEDYKNTKDQANTFFKFSAILSVLGFLAVLSGAILTLFIPLFLAILIAVAGIITDATSALIIGQAQRAYKRADEYHRERLQIKQLENLLTASNQLPDSKREECKDEIIRQTTQHWFSGSTKDQKTVNKEGNLSMLRTRISKGPKKPNE